MQASIMLGSCTIRVQTLLLLLLKSAAISPDGLIEIQLPVYISINISRVAATVRHWLETNRHLLNVGVKLETIGSK